MGTAAVSGASPTSPPSASETPGAAAAAAYEHSVATRKQFGEPQRIMVYSVIPKESHDLYKFRPKYMVRNTPFQNFRSESRGTFKPWVCNSIWLAPLITQSESCAMHCLLTTWSVFVLLKRSHAHSIVQHVLAHMLFLCFHDVCCYMWVWANNANNKNRWVNPAFPTNKWSSKCFVKRWTPLSTF